MSAQKSTPLTKEEVMQLVNLVEANPVVYSKATNAANNQLKDATWVTITNNFNSCIASTPRKPEQLRLKWENLKKAARKRSAKIRMNNLKTGGGKPEYIPPDDALEKVAGILGPTCEGYTVQFGGDALVEEIEVEELAVVDLPSDILPTPTSVPSPQPPVPPKRPKFFFSSTTSKGKLKRQTLAEELKVSATDRNRSLSNYYDSRKKWEEEINMLKIRKLQLEIQNVEKK